MIRQVAGRSVMASAAALRGGGGPNLPYVYRSFHRDDVPEEYDLLWADGVAPELMIDFDVPHTSTAEALLTMGVGFAFFGTVYAMCAWYDPPSKNKAAPREFPSSMAAALGGDENEAWVAYATTGKFPGKE
eukprot:PLAT14580.1.p1 GENE.PLAT14580.1~~PLAT14580.1.p1  ORF type:complete len:142 (-),score=53.95 PLAT14580.1:56-448(-)